MAMRWTLYTVRRWILWISVLLSTVTLGFSINLIRDPFSVTLHYFPGEQKSFTYRYFTVLPTITSLLHILSVPVLLILDLLGRKSFITTVVFEASWLFGLWSMWLACAGYITWSMRIDVNCNQLWATNNCVQYNFVQAASLINGLSLMIYANVLFTVAVMGHIRKQPVWSLPVSELPVLSPLVLIMPSGRPKNDYSDSPYANSPYLHASPPHTGDHPLNAFPSPHVGIEAESSILLQNMQSHTDVASTSAPPPPMYSDQSTQVHVPHPTNSPA